MPHDKARRYRRTLRGTCIAVALLMLTLFAGRAGYSQPAPSNPNRSPDFAPIRDQVANAVAQSGGLHSRVIERKLPAVQIGSNSIETKKQTAVQFQPFPVVDPQTGKPISPDTIITLPDGRKVEAGEYYASLNAIEQNFTRLGYSLRTMPNGLQLQETMVDRDLLRQQLAQVKPSVSQRVPAAILAQRFNTSLTTATGQRVLLANELTPQAVAAVRADRTKSMRAG